MERRSNELAGIEVKAAAIVTACLYAMPIRLLWETT